MNLLHYLVQVNLYLVLFYGFYRLLLSGETFYALNRAYLVGSAVLSFGIPFWYSDYIQSFFITQQVNEVFFSVLSPAVFEVRANVQNPFTWFDLLRVIYVSFTVFLAIKLIFNLLQLKKLLENSAVHQKQGAGFSFFNFVFVDKDLQKQEVVMEHEKVHIRQLHSADVMLFELIAVLCWFNPVVYFYKKSTKNIHEFIADDIASRLEPTKADYAMLLFSQQFGLNPHQLTNTFFNNSTLKCRIEMLQKPRSHKIALLKYGFTVPLFVLMLVIASASIAKHPSIKTVEIACETAANTPVLKLPNLVLKENIDKAKIEKISKDTSVNDLDEVVVVGYENNGKVYSEEVFTTVDENPTYIGGIKEMYKFIGQNLRYPLEAHRQNIQGKVFAKFIIRKDGSTSDIKVLKGIGFGCDEEVVRIIGMLPKWNAGKQNGKPVNVFFTMPVNFLIEGSTEGKTKIEKLSIIENGETKTWIESEDIKREYERVKKIMQDGNRSVDMTTTSDEKLVTFTIHDKIPLSSKPYNPKSETPKYNMNGAMDNALWVIDGITTTDKSSLKPEEIESISVLKDASAVATYGEKGRNGVIIITTKKKFFTKDEPTFTITGKQLYTIKVGKNREIVDAKTANEYPSDRIMQVNIIKLNDIKARKTSLNEYEEKVLKEGYDGWVDIWVKEQ